jgi:5-methylcytosine-specific restriction enzyme A
MLYPFIVGKAYTRRDVYRIIGINENTKGGNWETGYNKFKLDWFIFCNIGTAGRNGQDYENAFIEDDLLWHGKNNSHIHQPTIQSMLNPSGNVYLFARDCDRDPFTFLGNPRVKSFEDTIPVTIIWEFIDNKSDFPILPSDGITNNLKYIEGKIRSAVVNNHERNPIARRKCIEHYGVSCSICAFNFGKVYGEIGTNFIHVHHLNPISAIGYTYTVDPVEDLRPVCPNCHAMLHRKSPPYTIEELSALMISTGNSSITRLSSDVIEIAE